MVYIHQDAEVHCRVYVKLRVAGEKININLKHVGKLRRDICWGDGRFSQAVDPRNITFSDL